MSIRTQYDSDLEALKAALAEMGRSSADAVEDALEALCTADADRYPLDTDQITLRVSNVGDYEGELDKPRLEVQKNGAWYFVPPTDQTGETANLLYVSPGTSAAFDFSLTPYRAKLAPGQYRAVFGLHGSREFFSWEFRLE